jgi:glycosyltransferase involved in cell wall biosynthesis
MRPHRVVSVAHAYCVGLNRRLAHEMALVEPARWEVTAVAPTVYRGDLRRIALEGIAGEACGLAAVPVHLDRRIHVMFYGRPLRETLRARWDVVHCAEEPYVVAGSQVAAWSPREAAVVFTTSQNIARRYPPPFSWLERYAMRRAAAWIATGHTVAQTLAARDAYATRPHRVIPLGVDTTRFRPDARARGRIRRLLGWTDVGVPVVGFIGRFVPEKGLALLMRTLDATAIPWRVILLGGGPMTASLEAWARRHPGRVHIATGVPHEQVPSYVSAMDILCAPSQTTPRWREQLGRMLLEAFATGVAVIGSDSGEIPRVLGDAGVVVGERDDAGWVHALSALLQSPDRRTELGAKGRARAHDLFAWPRVARQYLALFDSLLDDRRARGAPRVTHA